MLKLKLAGVKSQTNIAGRSICSGLVIQWTNDKKAVVEYAFNDLD